MGMLNSFSQILIAKAFWSSCINFFVNFLGNYGWAIILFTVALKIILSPLDVLQRISMKKQTNMMASIQPELNKLQEKYANDKEMLNKKTSELYQRNNISLKSTCLPLLICMIITMVIFFSLFQALNGIANSKDSEIFYELDKSYSTIMVEVESPEYLANLAGKTDDEIALIQQSDINKAVLDSYKTQKDKHGFLWVQNLWKSDSTKSPFVSYKTYKAYYEKNVGAITNEEEFKAKFNEIIKIVNTKNSKHNGCYLLIILTALITFLVQWLSQKSLNKNSNNAQNASQQSNKLMLIVMPIVMLLFASSSNALFTLYIITNSVMSAIISKIIDLATKDKFNGTQNNIKKIKNKQVVEYSRNYFKGN